MTKLLSEPLEAIITPQSDIRGAFTRFWAAATALVDDGGAFELLLKPRRNTRSLQANACMWAHLSEVSTQVEWHGQKLTSEEWKDVFTAALKRQEVVPGIDGGFVVIGARTSRMSVSEMGELIELICAFGAEHDVKFKAPAWQEEWLK